MNISDRRLVRTAGLQSSLSSAIQGGIVIAVVLSLVITGVGCSSGGSNDEPPAAPSGLEATSGNAEVGLDWTSVDAADTYNVYRSTSSGERSSDPIEEDISSASYTDEAAENGTTYYYQVTAVGSDGKESDTSEEVEVTPFNEPPNRP